MEGVNLRHITKWFTLFSYVVVERSVIKEKMLTTELAGELSAEK